MLCCELDLPRQQDAVGSESSPLAFPRYVTAKRLDFVKALQDAGVQKELKEIYDMSEEGRRILRHASGLRLSSIR